MALGGALSLSLTSILIKHILVSYPISAVTLAFWRAVIIAVFLLGTVRTTRPEWLELERQDWLFYGAYGLLGVALLHMSWIRSVDLNGAALATVLVYLSPVVVTIASHFLFGEAITWPKRLALVLSLLGVVLVSGAYDLAQVHLQGLLIGLISALAYGGYTLFGKEAHRRHHPWVAMAYAFVVGAILMLFLARRDQLFSLGFNLRGWLLVILLALGPSLSGYSLIIWSLRDLPPGVASLVLPLEIVFTAVVAYFTLGETLTPLQIVGSVLVAASAVLVSWSNVTWDKVS